MKGVTHYVSYTFHVKMHANNQEQLHKSARQLTAHPIFAAVRGQPHSKNLNYTNRIQTTLKINKKQTVYKKLANDGGGMRDGVCASEAALEDNVFQEVIIKVPRYGHRDIIAEDSTVPERWQTKIADDLLFRATTDC